MHEFGKVAPEKLERHVVVLVLHYVINNELDPAYLVVLDGRVNGTVYFCFDHLVLLAFCPRNDRNLLVQIEDWKLFFEVVRELLT